MIPAKNRGGCDAGCRDEHQDPDAGAGRGQGERGGHGDRCMAAGEHVDLHTAPVEHEDVEPTEEEVSTCQRVLALEAPGWARLDPREQP